jgi:hypothetical protein
LFGLIVILLLARRINALLQKRSSLKVVRMMTQEQSFIDDYDGPGGKGGQNGGSANKRNQVDVTKDKRKYLGKLMDKFKTCK